MLRNFNRVWEKALARAAVPPPEGLHLHDLRHTGAILLVVEWWTPTRGLRRIERE